MHHQIYSFPEQIEDALRIGEEQEVTADYSGVSSVVIAGMGGSAIGGDLIRSLTSDSMRVPLEVVRDYTLPGWVNNVTFVICISYSGNTEETLSCLDDAMQKGAKVAGVTSGGELKERLIAAGADVIGIPGGNPPRASLGYVSIPVISLLERTGLLRGFLENELQSVASHVKNFRDLFSEDSDSNPTFALAEVVYDSIPVIYGDAKHTGSVALRWRGQFEENAKMVAFHHTLPEMNHNEIVGYQANPELLKRIGIIWLIDESHHERTARRQSLTRQLIGDVVSYQEEVRSEGNTLAERLFYLVSFGDWVSYWCAVMHRVDPTPVERIEVLKARLAGSD